MAELVEGEKALCLDDDKDSVKVVDPLGGGATSIKVGSELRRPSCLRSSLAAERHDLLTVSVPCWRQVSSSSSVKVSFVEEVTVEVTESLPVQDGVPSREVE